MKKLVLLAAALITAAACTAPTNQPAVSNANQNANVASTGPAMTEADAIAKEKAIWESIKNKDYDSFSNTLAEDQIEVLPDGTSDKAKSIAAIKQFEPAEITFADWKFKSIDDDAFLLTYSVTVKGKYQGREFPAETARASSAWVKRGDKWLAIYHQESPVMPPPPPQPSPAASPSAAASASPAATPPAVTADAEANEKMLWDLLKGKDLATFGTYLDESMTLVQPVGVEDKAATLRGLEGFDASKVTLSDFKTVKFDDDATLVTYLATIPGMKPPGERHSTIWANRDGKWRVIFHQVTPVRAGGSATPSPSATVTP